MPAGTNKWIREYELVFSSPDERLEISSFDQQDPLDIDFSVSYDSKSNSQGTMSLSIHGLGETSISKIMKLGVKCWLSVGHKDTGVSQIFSGDVREGKVEAGAGSHVLKLKVMSTRTDVKPVMETLPSGETHEARIRRMLNVMQTSLPNLSINGALSDLVRLVDEENTKDTLIVKGMEGRVVLTDLAYGSLTITGTLMDELQKLLKTFNIKAITVNDSIRLVREGGTIKNVNAIKASLGENMINPPRRILENMLVPTNTANAKKLFAITMLLEPTVNINSIIVASHIREDGGRISEVPTVLRVTEVSHKGKYRGNVWYTEIVGSVSEDYLTKAPIGSTAMDVVRIYKDPVKSKSGSDFGSTGGSFRGAGASGSW